LNSRLYVGNLSDSTDEKRLRAAFAAFGEILELRIVSDAESGRSRGFGFVDFSSEAAAQRATTALNRSVLDGHVLNVKLTGRLQREGFRGSQPTATARRPAASTKRGK
jgi:RNA recognition motif-containing protein